MESTFNSDGAAERAEQLNALLLIIFENDSMGIEKNHPLIGNALNLSSYIQIYFHEEAKKNDQHR